MELEPVARCIGTPDLTTCQMKCNRCPLCHWLCQVSEDLLSAKLQAAAGIAL